MKCDDVTEENHGGKLLKEFLRNGEYILVNDTDKSIGGPNTRYSPEDPNNESKKSMLDLVIVSKDLYEYVVKLEIDKDLKWTPCRPVKNSKLCYTDHYALVLVLKNIPKRNDRKLPKQKPVIWNTNKKGDGYVL